MDHYSSNDLLDLELHYSKALVRDEEVLQLIEYVKELHAQVECDGDLTEKLEGAEKDVVKLKEDIVGLENTIEDLEAEIEVLEENISKLEEAA